VFALGSVLVYRAVHERPNLDGVPSSLRAVAARCLDPKPDNRPTPAELLAETGRPATGGWLPADLVAEVDRHRTELLAGPARPPTRELTAGNGAVFRTSRSSPLLWGTLFGLAALLFAAEAGAASKAHDSGAGLLFVNFVLFAIGAVYLLWTLTRPRYFVEVSGDGLTIGRGTHHRELAWSRIARVRIVGKQRRPWLVVWLTAGDLGAKYRRHHGGFRVYPVGHERMYWARAREARELGAALGWYGGASYDPTRR